MDFGAFRFKIGAFECVSISDGNFNYPLESFFANVPKEQIEANTLYPSDRSPRLTLVSLSTRVSTGC
jgi:hypothetical protein